MTAHPGVESPTRFVSVERPLPEGASHDEGRPASSRRAPQDVPGPESGYFFFFAAFFFVPFFFAAFFLAAM
jgi:hypothetical protein